MQNSELKLAVEDAPPDIKRCAAVIVQQREQRELAGRIERALRVALTKPAPKRRSYATRSPGVNADGSIYRSAPHLRTTEERLRCGCSQCRGLIGEYGQGYKRFR